ncbi:glycosyltransferase family 87 protein [Capnocytophaga canimorsus]|uniref:glycosyltransferase family 87 protein n=1 Tax=Capnocytophaga canimorsus TaxID=28188 RepID=UPI000D6E04CA|nr:glycosyltransferase family 87 protein [Capnocytophaga canimorsus]AWL79543.1 glycosyl transferase family 2 [Capnocytophaga canimorsus]AYW38013.1 DUF2029 domain-containing protein [Capnocytophaga canimorsus]MDT9500051.1 DUF2029 domain-containing protein [Capnocytophaga canimorsus]
MMLRLFRDFRFVTLLWFGLALATVIQNVFIRGKYNNYLIFEGVFRHTIGKLSLYAEYPTEYFDVNHYGILFSAIIAPFAVLPNWLGCSLWIMSNVLFLYWAIRQLPLKQWQIIGILIIAAHDLYTAAAMQQFNISIIAILVGTFVFIEKGKSHWATLLIVIGILTKIYGIVGLAFFFFSKDKIRFIGSGLLWLVILFCLPMLYSSPQYVISQYQEWFERLAVKNNSNMNALQYNLQNLSLLGFLQRTGVFNNNLVVIVTGLVLFTLPYLRFNQYQNKNFRLMFLASVSMFLCLFSTGTENSTYIIAYVGIGIWFVASPNQNKWLKISLLSLTILASLSPTDIFKPLKEPYIIKYSLRAIPVAIVWLVMIWEMCFLNYKDRLLFENRND